MVLLSALAMAMSLPARVQIAFGNSAPVTAAVLAAFVLAYALAHIPFDILGGYVLPRQYGRTHAPLVAFFGKLARGAAIHASVLLASAAMLTVGGLVGGVAGTVIAASVLIVILLKTRVTLASLVAPLNLTSTGPSNSKPDDSPPILLGESDDEGFTGGILGIFQPVSHLLPLKWRQVLGREGFELAFRRRSLAITDGAWRRGRLVAVAFTLIGVGGSALLAGPERLGTAAGTIGLSLWFTLWSFLGLLVLPTLSRRGVAEIDQKIRKAGISSNEIDRVTHLLDGLQDDEPSRPPFTETIFHPIPSAHNRLSGTQSDGVWGAWDAARTTVFLSATGIGLLGRAVHCNCGRPALWVFLPTD
jgi:hypothetical protein